MRPTTKKKEAGMTIPGVARKEMTLWLIGDSPLILHAWSPEARGDMLRKQMGMPTRARKPKDPSACVNACFYVHENQYVFPSNGFKMAAVSACRFVEQKMTETRGMFYVLGEFTPIHGTDPIAREDMVRVGMGTADIRYRPEFTEWAAPLQIEFNAAFVRPEQIVNLFENAGFGVGVGEWRPEKDGPFGRFHVARDGEQKRFEKMIPSVKPIVVDVGLSEAAE